MEAQVKQQWFKPGQLSKMSGLSRRFITQLVEEGRIEASRIGTRTTLISAEAWEAFIRSHKVGGIQ